MAILALKQLNLTKNIVTGCFEVEVSDYDWYDYEGLQDIFFMDEHTAVATLVLCRRERIGDYMRKVGTSELAGEPELAKLDTAG